MSNPSPTPNPTSGNPTATNLGASKTTSTVSGAARIFREFKWGLLTLFLLMAVVIGLIYDGSRRKEQVAKPPPPAVERDPAARAPAPPLPSLEQEGAIPTLPPAPAPALPPAPPSDAAHATTPPGTPSLGTAEAPGARRGPGTPRVGSETAAVHTPSASSGAETSYTVAENDNLSTIARKLYPNRVRDGLKALKEANKGVFADGEGNVIHVGVKLKVPALPAATEHARTPETAGAPHAAPAEGSVYVVEEGDNLEKIARKVLNDGHRWRDIYEWNRDQLADPSLLHVGQKLKIKKTVAAAGEGHAGAPETASTAHPDAATPARSEPSAGTEVATPRWMP